MENIARDITPVIQKWLFKQKVIIIFGPRQVGKTTLAKKLLNKHGDKRDYYNCELLSVKRALEEQDPTSLKRLFGNSRMIVLDEAQSLSNVGLLIKSFHDMFPDVQIIATGSSSFELSNHLNEPLTGRALEFKLYPFSVNELKQVVRPIDFHSTLRHLLIYGSYPEIFLQSESDARVLLENLTTKYLYQDILKFEQLKKPDLLIKLLQLLAFQIGQEVSLHELAVSLQTKRETVERYLNLLEKCFVIVRLKGLSRNLRKEISKKEKIYFYDLGVRNSIIAQFNSIDLRNDVGQLWENFCIVERLKRNEYRQAFVNRYFWRTHDQKEIDYIEEYNGVFHAYEFKWSEPKKYTPPKVFKETYPNSEFKLIHQNNYEEFLE